MTTPFIYFAFNSTLRGYVLGMFGKGNVVVPTAVGTTKLGSTHRN